jgi:quinol monooxygenase YgiN
MRAGTVAIDPVARSNSFAILSVRANNGRMSTHQTVICTFRVKADSMAHFRELLDRHWPVLRKRELVTDTAEQLFVDDDDNEPTIVSIFEWASDEAASQAHHHPDVAEIWEAMEPFCEPRSGRPSMEFPHFQPLPLKR